MYRKRFYATQLMKLAFQTLMYVTVFIAFFGLLSFTNPAILNLSRTAVVTMATFACSMLLLTIVYGGFDVGVKKKRSVFAGISLSTFFTDIITYIMLQIMNTKKVKDLDVATKVSVQLQLTDPDLKSRDRVVKKSEKDNLYTAMDVAAVWLERSLSSK